MPLEISPVLAGTYDAPNYIPPQNVASTQVDDTGAIDSRRYTKFDHSATDAGEDSNFSFSDFLDMINPLEHIPVISSIYREIAGDTINPVSRVVGDTLYGGLLGVASAIVGGIGAAGDAVVEAQTGKDSTGNVVASLFESDKPASVAPATTTPTTQLAQVANPAIPGTMQTAAATSAQINARAKLQAATTVAATSAAVAAAMPSTRPSAFPSAGSSPRLSSAAQLANAMSGGNVSSDPAAALSPLNAAKAFAIDPKKLPYGGVMDPAALQGSNMALALANSAPGLQMNHMVYTGRTMNGVKPSPTAAITSPAPSSSPTVAASAPDALPSSLTDDIAALRAINQYRSTASQAISPGITMNVVN